MNISNRFKVTIFSAAVGLLLVAGCVRSLHPLYTQDSLVFEEAILGQWTSQDAEQKWEFSRRGNRAYRVELTDDEDRTARFIVRLTKIEDELFMDFYPVRQRGGAPDFYDLHLMRVHSFARVHQLEPTLQFSLLNHTWLDNHLQENPDAIAYEGEGKTFVLTASTDELRDFIGTHQEAAFTKPITLERDE